MTKKSHILFLCSWYPSEELPTNGDFIERHAEAIGTVHRISVLHIITHKESSKSKIVIKTKGNVRTHIGYLAPTANPILKWIRYVRIFVRLLKSVGHFDLVHLHVIFPFGLFALFLKTIQKKPYLITEHWTGYLQSKQHQISRLHKIIAKRVVSSAAYVCPVSIALMNDMKAFGLSGRYAPVGNVVDTEIFLNKRNKDQEFTIIHISGFNEQQKNISGMLRAAKKLENEMGTFRWKFIGGNLDNYADLIEKLAFKYATIEAIDHCSQEVLAQHLQQAHVCISFSNYETFGITITEAIASGTLVIATPTGIVDELSKEARVTSVPIGDESALVDAIKRVKSSAITVDSDAMNLYIKKRYGTTVITEQFSKLYQNILHNPS